MIHVIYYVILFGITLTFAYFLHKKLKIFLVENEDRQKKIEVLTRIVSTVKKSIEDNENLKNISEDDIENNSHEILNSIINISKNSEYISQNEKDYCNILYDVDINMLSDDAVKGIVHLILF